MMKYELSSNNSPLVIAVQNSDGILQPLQELKQFLYGNRDMRILCMLHGQDLFDILYDDHGLVRYADNKFALNKILEIDNWRTVMSIVGKIGESVIVRRCAQYPELNLIWMKIASRRQVQNVTAQKYRAVGTGFKSTEQNYPSIYNPNDTQRDIIWLDETGNRYQMFGSTSISGKAAGLQVKVSFDGMKYIFNDVLNAIYEVPVVYFDMNYDYGRVYKKIQQELIERGDYTRNLQEWFVSGREIDPESFNEVSYYTDMVREMVSGRLTIEDLINQAEQFTSFGSAVMASAMEKISSEIYLEA